MKAAGTELGRIKPGLSAEILGKQLECLEKVANPLIPWGKQNTWTLVWLSLGCWCLRGGNGLCVHTHFPPGLGKGKNLWNFGF